MPSHRIMSFQEIAIFSVNMWQHYSHMLLTEGMWPWLIDRYVYIYGLFLNDVPLDRRFFITVAFLTTYFPNTFYFMMSNIKHRQKDTFKCTWTFLENNNFIRIQHAFEHKTTVVYIRWELESRLCVFKWVNRRTYTTLHAFFHLKDTC